VLLLLSALLPLNAQVGKVGINTTTPAATLHVADSSVLFTGPDTLPGSPAPPPVSGPGTRMMWYADKAAIRAGHVLGLQWDKDSVGVHSAAFGLNLKAKGFATFIGGGQNNSAIGTRAFVGGGIDNKATGSEAVAAGGENNTASGSGSFIGGGVDMTASGSRSFVGGGFGNIASGSESFIGGGQANRAPGLSSFVGGGSNNKATGDHSFAGGGGGLLARSFGESVVGVNNTDYTPASTTAFNTNDRLFVIGNGTDSTARRNAVTVLKNGRVGIGTATPAARLHVLDSSVVFTGPATLPASPGAPPVSGPGTRMMWYPEKAAFRAGQVGGTEWNRDSVGVNSAAFGAGAKAKGAGSFVGGGSTNTASGSSSFIGGGLGNNASGNRSFVGGGSFNTVSGFAAFVAGGENNVASGYGSFTGAGVNLRSPSFCEVVFGLNNTLYTPSSATSFNADDRLFVIGNGSSTFARSNAVTVLKNGRVGIGTDTPDLLMEIRGPASSADGATLALGGIGSDQAEAGRIRFLDGTTSTNWRGIYMHHDGTLNKFHIGVHSNSTNDPADDLPIITIERGDNQVGIGTTTPGFLFEVNGSAGKPGGGSWGASSDVRLKTNVAPYTDGLASVLSIDPVTYRYNELSGYDPGKTYVGVIAQQLQEVAPYMVSVSDRVAADGQTGYLTVDNSAMTYMLINAVKEQHAIIEEQQRLIGQQQHAIQIQDARMANLEQQLANVLALLVTEPVTSAPEKEANE